MRENEGTIEIPMGLARAMAESTDAFTAFCSLSDGDRASFIARAREVKDPAEMARLVAGLSEGQSIGITGLCL